MRSAIVFVIVLVLGLVLQVSAQQPAAPVNVINRCLNHIVNICPGWSDPAGVVFATYEVSYVVQGSGAIPTIINFATNSGQVSGLLPATTYDFFVTGITGAGVRSLPSITVAFTTDPADAKLDPTRDITNIQCNDLKDTASHDRYEIVCTWTAAAPVTPIRINAKVHCVSAIREPLTVRKNFYGTAAAATTVTFHVHRDVATCAVYLRAFYPRRPASRHSLTVITGQQ